MQAPVVLAVNVCLPRAAAFPYSLLVCPVAFVDKSINNMFKLTRDVGGRNTPHELPLIGMLDSFLS